MCDCDKLPVKSNENLTAYVGHSYRRSHIIFIQYNVQLSNTQVTEFGLQRSVLQELAKASFFFYTKG